MPGRSWSSGRPVMSAAGSFQQGTTICGTFISHALSSPGSRNLNPTSGEGRRQRIYVLTRRWCTVEVSPKMGMHSEIDTSNLQPPARKRFGGARLWPSIVRKPLNERSLVGAFAHCRIWKTRGTSANQSRARLGLSTAGIRIRVCRSPNRAALRNNLCVLKIHAVEFFAAAMHRSFGPSRRSGRVDFGLKPQRMPTHVCRSIAWHST